MRNQPMPLTREETKHQMRVRDVLVKANREVKVTYTKRDGSKSSSTGKVTYFNGQIGMDTGSVTIETTYKGPRTINLHRVIQIDPVS